MQKSAFKQSNEPRKLRAIIAKMAADKQVLKQDLKQREQKHLAQFEARDQKIALLLERL